ncbi:MADS-box transcription factor PHERES 2-like [Cucumis melo var. makuwa]|uniref:MADS-box transcription factor PHERES 2-like n=1 Tax=Cucumis melo var. makuwa TaxID=1194695 RepID=A0A5A7VNH8_CUCMM|nr:MADS-box transcription factor PHERES 2-like [Cucumis melo var. makuwa]TYK21056.1 MADS-box transcription factor PHERES 2-like [Cucumis melo var. makuwa]
MSEEKTIVEFNVRVLDIANESDALREKMFDAKLVRKVLRSLPTSRDSGSSYYQRPSNSNSSSDFPRRKEYKQSEKDYGSSKFERTSKAIRCHECERFRHFQTECPTYLKRKKKILVVALTDDEDSSESDEEEVGRALINISTAPDKREDESVGDQMLDQQAQASKESLHENDLKRKWEGDHSTIKQQQERI